VTAQKEYVMRKGENIMRVRNEKSGGESELRFISTYVSAHDENKSSRLRQSTSLERNIERLWFQSRTLGWSYNDFVAHLLEILLILRHRDSVKPRLHRKEELPHN
jgi:hypothetical protein